MKSNSALTGVVGSLAMSGIAWAAPFTPGNLVVSRIGTGIPSIANNVANAVFLDEFSTSGSPSGNSVALPTAAEGANFAATILRSSTSQGQLQQSGDGRFLSIIGYDQPIGTTGGAGNAAFRGRTVALVDLNGNVDTTTRYEAAAATPRSAYTPNGTDIYTTHDGGSGSPLSGGLRYMTLGQTTGGTILNGTTANIRVVGAFNNQLYASAATGIGGDFRGVFSVGSGFPTGGTTFALLPGFGRLGGAADNGNSDSSYDFYFANANTLYVTDDDSTVPVSGGLQKWVFNGTEWTKLWQSLPAGTSGVRSISGVVDDAGGVSLYVITATTGDGNALLSINDTLLANTVPAAGFTTLATAPANTVFRGVDFAPIPEPASLAVTTTLAFISLRRRRRN